MTPFETLSAVTAILQLSEQGWKLACKATEIYRSKQHTTNEVHDFITAAESFMRLGQWTEARAWSASGKLSPAEVSLRNAAVEARKAAVSFLDLLQTLKVDGSWKTWGAIKVALKSTHLKNEMNLHVSRLRDQRMNLLMELQGVMFDQQTNMTALIRDLVEWHRVFSPLRLDNIKQKGKLSREEAIVEAIKTDIPLALKQLEAGHDIPPELLSRLEGFLCDPRAKSARLQILKSLRFDSRLDRCDKIKIAHRSTYEWIVNRRNGELNDFVQWMESDDGMFWISGKAGCGKSTLMKFISSHPKTDVALMKWANGRRLFVASYYFWNPGTEMQRSQKGLLQSILHDILHQVPELAEKICPGRWNIENSYLDRKKPWTLEELRKSFELLVNCQVTSDGKMLPICFCVFIDGLDEYQANHAEGDHDEMISLLQSMASSPNFKACVSSRPWPVFVDAFSDVTAAGKQIEMHELTFDDIHKYVTDTLTPHIPKIRDRDLEATIVSDITDKAEGVFLWVFLVVQELIKGIRMGDTVQDLRERLAIIPPHLEDYFLYIFQRMDDKVHKRKGAQIFLACSQTNRPVPLPAFVLFDQEDPFAHTLAISHKTPDLDWLRAEETERAKRRIYALCGDLLEVRKSIRHLSRPTALVTTVDFLHRTVKEFLELADIRDMFKKRAGSKYNATAALCAMNLYLMKRWYAYAGVAGSVAEWPQDFLDYALELDRESNKRIVDLLRGFHKITNESIATQKANGGTSSSPSSVVCEDTASFLAFLESNGFKSSFRSLSENVGERAEPHGANTSVSKMDKGHLGFADAPQPAEVQIREVTLHDVNINDLVLEDHNTQEPGSKGAYQWLRWKLWM